MTLTAIDAHTPEAPTFVVGLGASAGGLNALERFFAQVEPTTAFAYAVVTHTSATRASLLTEILARHCLLPVEEVSGNQPLVAGKVYVAPPGASLHVAGGRISPHTPSAPSGDLPIDAFFRSMAHDLADRAIGIVLSGTGSDGTLGLKEIRAAGGLVIAQQEDTAAHVGMPHSAIVSLQIDHVLAPEAMPGLLASLAEQQAKRRSPFDPNEPSDTVLKELLGLLRSRTGHDFVNYKTSSIRRRIVRRLNIHQLANGGEYLKLVKNNPTELDSLLKELLISVTSFFRDGDAYEFLKTQILPQIIAERDDNKPIRVWVPGCATGEEAYSLAMLLRECLDESNANHSIQVFATDLDADAIEQARAGVFPLSIATDVGPERLARFFTQEEDGYRINKETRDSLIFARQNIVSDPPFTNLDLLSCRNLLIYLDTALQKRLMPLFHYTLRPGGILFLGSAETIGNATSLFDCIDKRWKIFRRRQPHTHTPTALFAQVRDPKTQMRDAAPALETRPGPEATLATMAEKALLEHLLPPTALIHEAGDIVHIHGRTGQFLEPAPGDQARANIFNMVRPGLQLELAMAIRSAKAAGGKEIIHEGAEVQTPEGPLPLKLRVRQLLKPEPLKGLVMVTFEQRSVSCANHATKMASRAPHPETQSSEVLEVNEWVQHLEREMRSARELHLSAVKDLETTNQRFRSANEELQSSNEEMQSTNEELETSKEEMQSLTEELYTVNAELQSKVEDLSRAHDDMKNLLNGTDIAMLFLDNKLNIKRFTQEASQIVSVIASDLGRPVADLMSKLQYKGLVADAQEVLRTLVHREAEVQGKNGRWYLMRILPYRTADNVIDGIVLTFVDITAVKALKQRTEHVFAVLGAAVTTVFAQDLHLRYEWVYNHLFDQSPETVRGKTDYELLTKDDADKLQKLKQEVLASGQSTRKLLHLQVGGRVLRYRVYLEPLRSETRITGLVGVLGNIEVDSGESAHAHIRASS